MRSAFLLVALLLGLVLNAEARDPAQVRAFRATHPCPLTGKTTGACEKDGKRMVVDHQLPVCLQPYVTEILDRPENMAWQDYAESLEKDRAERQLCARLRRCGSAP